MLRLQRISRDVLREKYAKGEERSSADVHARVAAGLAEVEREKHDDWRDTFRRAQEGGFIPAGRISAAAGTPTKVTWINCFVQPVGDCVSGTDDDRRPGIYEALREAAETLRRGGGVGYDFSPIRPHGALVKGTGSTASGPVSYMRVFDTSCRDGRVGRRAPGRPDGHPAGGPPGHPEVHPGEGRSRRTDQLQYFGGRDGRVHEGRPRRHGLWPGPRRPAVRRSD